MSPSTDLTMELPPVWIISPSKAEDCDEKCRTPTTEDSRLHCVSPTCPPAPKKTRPVIRCKRRLLELEFIAVGTEEMQRLFKQRGQAVSAPSTPSPRLKKPRVSASA